MDFKEQNCHYSTPYDEYCGESKQEVADDTDDNYNNDKWLVHLLMIIIIIVVG